MASTTKLRDPLLGICQYDKLRQVVQSHLKLKVSYPKASSMGISIMLGLIPTSSIDFGQPCFLVSSRRNRFHKVAVWRQSGFTNTMSPRGASDTSHLAEMIVISTLPLEVAPCRLRGSRRSGAVGACRPVDGTARSLAPQVVW